MAGPSTDSAPFYAAREVVRRFVRENPRMATPVIRESKESGEEGHLLDFRPELMVPDGTVSFAMFRQAVETMREHAPEREKSRIFVTRDKILMKPASVIEFLTDMEPDSVRSATERVPVQR